MPPAEATAKTSSLLPALLLLATAAVVVGLVASTALKASSSNRKPKRSATTTRTTTPAVTAEPVTNAAVTPVAPQQGALPPALWQTAPHEPQEEGADAAFPSMASDGDHDAQLAQAFTYENLQESMLNSGKESRDHIKSRAAWSRLGQRGDSAAWEAQMDVVKQEIVASGQTLEQFMDSAWMPIPEQMAAYWKEEAKPAVTQRAAFMEPAPPRHARSEAASLAQDAMQAIPSGDEAGALARLQEILAARKRAKALSLKLPEPTEQQRTALLAWEQAGASQAAGLSRAILSLL